MTDSWRQPRRLLLLALGALTVFFLMAPTLVVVPMSVTASNALTFPPEGFSTRWYEKMLTDPQWSSGFVNSGTSLRTIDRNLELAAMNLGADPVRTFRRVTLPLILPGVLAGGLFAFITSWDEVVVSIFLTTARFRTMPVEMWEQVRQVVDPTVAAVATTLLAVTTSLLLLILVVRRQAPAR